ncbi:PQQ-binding-like beta-propeller repeat protein [Aliifodinibius salicampi]|uniref:PQQ-binding-like beta-propeller repeat protein n=1 Tax=Fodinibius salicampi TaxID=1920655 RepID=A0ABT3Q0W4_9BACT|nr:PQQ-binding-like beta-propeller repeat protein [Fodinibius salicampi]MCW9713762.1 PQQ-binding-like beta-propeller repeat protein [Fodinibius salicampi]
MDRTYQSWEVRGGDAASIRYSSLDQVDTTNVDQLQQIWSYSTEDADTAKNSQIQANAIVIDQTLYATSPGLKVFALDAATGEEQWVFNPFPDSTDIVHWLNVNRGVTYWEDGEDQRILFTAGPELYALDAKTGTLVESFGDKGKASLKQGLGERAEDLSVTATSPGVIFEDLIIIGSRVSEGDNAAPGGIRAFNVRTGELAWTFHTIPRPGEFGYESWDDPDAWKRIGGANSWAGMSVDNERGIVYIPTGSASPDFYGGDRKGKNLFANTLLALDAATGDRVWHYQTIHHDLWDRDLPSPPALVTVTHEGEEIDAVAQTTKSGFLFLFDRETGEPLFPVEEVEVPTNSNLDGEEVWPTQPMPTKPEPFVRQHMDTTDINPYVSQEVQAELKKQLLSLNSDHMFAPPSLRGTLMFPGFDGGAEWGGSAFDPETGVLYVNSNEVPWIMTMVPTDQYGDTTSYSGQKSSFLAGEKAYMTNCMSCHGPDREGGGNNPSLVDVEERYSPEELFDLIESGRRMMPGFAHLSESKKKAIINFIIGDEFYQVEEVSDKEEVTDEENSSPYVMAGYKKFRRPEGYPANSPPWGTLNAINLNTGEHEWGIPLGEYPDLRERGIAPTGTENYGGPVVTAGGLVFIAATLDEKIRAFDKQTGELLWEHDLPAAGFATPSVYEIDGKQYLVIACGGGKLGATSGDEYVAFVLPDSML